MAPDAVLGRNGLAALSEAQPLCAMSRLDVLLPHLHQGVPLSRAAAAAGVPARTAERWLSLYRSGRLVGLAAIDEPPHL
jgi:putative transposase